jgi:CubicO group peptidase (beta-lactamase class C family)
MPPEMSVVSRRRVLKHGLAAGIASVASTGWAQPATEEIRPDERAAMAAAANAFMEEYDVPGLSVAVAQNGSLAYAQGFGVADKKTGEKVTPAHLFRIASISKPITSVAIFSLVEQGRLKLADKVFGAGGILESDHDVPPAKKYINNITIGHLLTHASGGWPNGPNDPMSAHKEMNHRKLISWTLNNLPLTSPPGTKFIYSKFRLLRARPRDREDCPTGVCRVRARVCSCTMRYHSDEDRRKHACRPSGWRGRVSPPHKGSLRKEYDEK